MTPFNGRPGLGTAWLNAGVQKVQIYVKRSIGVTIGFHNHGEGPLRHINAKVVVAAFNQEKAPVGALSVIVQLHRLIVYSTGSDILMWR